MHIAGFKESSLNEWEGRVSSIIWTSGCNWRCSYCHASHLILEPEKLEAIEESIIFDYMKSKDGWVDGLCISGGEPTLQPDLIDFIKRVKSQLNVEIKLETNGSNPEILSELINEHLINCLSLDFKHLPENVHKISKVKESFNVLQSYNLAFRAEIEVEFHTTLCPAFINIDDIIPMAKFLHNKGTWVLQQYNPDDVLELDRAGNTSYSKEEISRIYKTAKEHHKDVILKNI